jgi:two-component system cell cycle response regulator
MSRRVLVAVESKPVVSALLRSLEPAGLGVDVVPPAEAAATVDPARHEVALLRAATGAEAVVAALRKADPHLAVVALFFDEEEASAFPGAFGADGVLVGPLTPAQVTGTCGLAARLTRARRQLAEQARQADQVEQTKQEEQTKLVEQAEQAGAEAPRAASGAHDLTFLKRLLFVEVKRSRRYGFPLSLALVSVDGWEALSEKLGPRARAALLGDMAVAAATAVRDIDVSVPLSDDRLVVLMPHTATAGGLQVARRICARVRERKGAVAVTVSVGLASHDGHGTVSFGALVKRASEAMARAREAGGDRAESAEPMKRRSRISIG